MLRLVLEDQGWEDYASRLKADRKWLARINKLIEDVRRDPFTGIGKPEPLRYHLPGAWSRRIDDEHRLVSRARRRAGVPSGTRSAPTPCARNRLVTGSAPPPGGPALTGPVTGPVTGPALFIIVASCRRLDPPGLTVMTRPPPEP